MDSLLSEIKRINTLESNSNAVSISNDTVAASTDSPAVPPPPSPEDLEQMVAFLLQLDELKLADPDNYSKTLVSMGLAPEGFSVTSTPDKDPLLVMNESLKDVKASFLRSKLDPSKFKLPDGSSLLGDRGLESKVHIVGRSSDRLTFVIIMTYVCMIGQSKANCPRSRICHKNTKNA